MVIGARSFSSSSTIGPRLVVSVTPMVAGRGVAAGTGGDASAGAVAGAVAGAGTGGTPCAASGALAIRVARTAYRSMSKLLNSVPFADGLKRDDFVAGRKGKHRVNRSP
ncbi:hypothetical protein SPHINGOT1_70249 [Sphingomonas sp. T1]|nr:hypothetical protein SPHINGOT1_70249 [Sphingomonas sp. T1]